MKTLIDPINTYSLSTPDRIAVGDLVTGEALTWRELNKAVDQCAAWLEGELGAKSGERVVALARNHPNLLILQWACTRAGAIYVPLNWRLAKLELAGLLDDAKPKLIFSDPEFELPSYPAKTFELKELPNMGHENHVPSPSARLDFGDPMTLLYTSGTSGTPKGVIVTTETAFWGCTNFAHGSLVSHRSVFLCDMPLFHVAGMLGVVGVSVLSGATVWISPGFDPQKTIARIGDEQLGITHYFSVPQMATVLWQHPDFTPEKFSRLHLYVTGGAPNPRAQVERYGREGIAFSDGYGSSETGSNFCMPVQDWQSYVEKAGSCGLPLLSVQMRIVNEQGQDLPTGEVGELWLQGPSITPGYWNKPETTAAAFEDGWFKTGDAAKVDDEGYLYLVDRKKDMFISGGENVYPAEVERAISELETVAEVAVIGVPDERWGEVGRAFVTVRSGADLTPEAIIAHCESRLAKFKVPKVAVIREDLPKTASGKVQKHLLNNE